MKICVLFPAYNEVRTIAGLVREVRGKGLDAVVVDDGSADATARTAEGAGAIVIRHEKNSGKGQALRTGFAYITGRDYDGAIIMDADGQHLAREIDVFIERAKLSPAGIIIGNRMHCPAGMPFVRRITNIITSRTVSLLAGCDIPDTQCGYRFIRSGVLKSLRLSTDKYETESEILIEAARHHVAIESIPVTSIYADQKSQIHPVIDTIRFWRLIFRSIAGKK
ncbi:MAG: glycosyltransferase family 2 protein [Candidatus Omnitrophica bacterium]|jgi:Glycosyltransferases involved in cell wall biogenesis|nr:glycosyltransferase family 2 protein [Candidatus Omnitrophota bacterium]